jgi:hypothetical protein
MAAGPAAGIADAAGTAAGIAVGTTAGVVAGTSVRVVDGAAEAADALAAITAEFGGCVRTVSS